MRDPPLQPFHSRQGVVNAGAALYNYHKVANKAIHVCVVTAESDLQRKLKATLQSKANHEDTYVTHETGIINLIEQHTNVGDRNK
jgi:hypothetical protein